MEILKVEDVTFTYPNEPKPVLNNIKLKVASGEFVTLIGQSGCGKSTLLKQLKKELQPHGDKSGAIYYQGENLEQLDAKIAATEIGYVMQSPENQIVTDKVWHELAFGLENLGMDQLTIRRRVAEMANFFGIHKWFREKTTVLSGGQKQLLNLASVLVGQPKVLLLDEPTSQLDPIAAMEFIQTLKRLNEELGITIICIEHRLEELLPISNRVVVMEQGEIIYDGTPRKMLLELPKEHPMITALPTATKIFAALDGEGEAPLTIREGQQWLRSFSWHEVAFKAEEQQLGSPILEAKNIAFRYERNAPDILQQFELSVHEGEFYTIIGGNGTGKSTALNVLAGLEKPYRGEVLIFGKNLKQYRNQELYRQTVAYLPQDPKILFTEKTAEKELQVVEATEQRMAVLIEQLHLQHILMRHPYDLSGGEQQRLALAKVLLLEPKLLFLDEPTKGLDAHAKEELAAILHQLQRQGLTIVMVTHDIEFSAQYSSRCALFFDGSLVSQGTPRSFYSGNSFYTTAAHRIARSFEKEVITYEDVVTRCQKTEFAYSSI
ncbi:ATP-binding cassette domain-containing protein [Solibacillus sp. FSL W8-0474]|uniref:ABC transporter ATP-binding protein n=1 Tax=Solibacillus sp. FSL W8-0474 TaxID=2975336 RepID=UPI0030F6A724